MQGFNRYAYGNNNPYKFTDPDGREVKAVYDLTTKNLTVTDVKTKNTITIKAVSGGKPFGAPIPAGKYEILDQGRNPDSYRLDAVDSSPRDDQTDSGRSLLRAHGPDNTIGCIAAEDAGAWSDTQEILNNTETTTVTDNSTPWYKSTESIKKYGELEVVESGKDK
jgi:hypothetical protein